MLTIFQTSKYHVPRKRMAAMGTNNVAREEVAVAATKVTATVKMDAAETTTDHARLRLDVQATSGKTRMVGIAVATGKQATTAEVAVRGRPQVSVLEATGAAARVPIAVDRLHQRQISTSHAVMQARYLMYNFFYCKKLIGLLWTGSSEGLLTMG